MADLLSVLWILVGLERVTSALNRKVFKKGG